jgi:hypothetical protein
MKEIDIIDVSQFSKWTDEILSLQADGRFQDTANLVRKIYSDIDKQELKRENESEWVTVLLDERTLAILSEAYD